MRNQPTPTLKPAEARLQIGQVASLSGLSVKTLRFYEASGLIEAVERTSGGFRLFDRTVLARLSFIKRSQALGMRLADICEFLAVRDQGQVPCDLIQSRLTAQVAAIETKIADLEVLKQQLIGVLETWQTPAELIDSSICPNLESPPPYTNGEAGESTYGILDRTNGGSLR